MCKLWSWYLIFRKIYIFLCRWSQHTHLYTCIWVQKLKRCSIGKTTTTTIKWCLWKSHLDAMKGVMSNSRGKETYVVIFLRSLAECSKRWRWPERGEGEGEEKWRDRGGGKGRRKIFRNNRHHHYNIQNTRCLVQSGNTLFPRWLSHIYVFIKISLRQSSFCLFLWIS